MSLRKTILFAIAVTFIGLFFLLIVNLRTILSDYFFQQERSSINYDLQRSQAAILSEMDSFHALMTDWFRKSKPPKTSELDAISQLKSTLDLPTLETFKLAYAQIYDSRGILQHKIQRLTTIPEINHPDFLQGVFRNPEFPVYGLYIGTSIPVLVDRQIFSNDSGTPLVFIILVRAIDPAQISRDFRQPGYQVKILPAQDADVPQELKILLPKGAEAIQPVIRIPDQDTITGYLPIKNSLGQTDLVLKLTEPRNIYRNGQLMINFLILYLTASSVVFSIIMILLMERLILSRLFKLSSEVNKITLGADPSGRVTVTRKDELSRLSENINSLLSAMEKSSNEQKESVIVLGKLEQDLRIQVKRLEALHHVARVFLPQSDVNHSLSVIARQAVEKMNLDGACVAKYSLAQSSLEILSRQGRFELPADHPALMRMVATYQKQHKPVFQNVESLSDQNLILATLSGAIHLLYEDQHDQFFLVSLSQNKDYFTLQEDFFQAFVSLGEIKLQSAFLYEEVRNGRETLSVLSHRLVEIQEEERRWIAQELHDEIGQILTGLKLVIESSRSVPETDKSDSLLRANEIVNELIGKVRQMSLDLRPAMLDDLGLLPGLLWLFERYSQQTRVEVEFSHFNIEGRRFSPEFETAVYRVIQEGLTNVARHAQIDHVTIQLWADEFTINVHIEDRGKGFDMQNTLANGKTRGLVGIRERVEFLKGKLTIDACPGEGTSLTIELPLDDGAIQRENAL